MESILEHVTQSCPSPSVASFHEQCNQSCKQPEQHELPPTQPGQHTSYLCSTPRQHHSNWEHQFQTPTQEPQHTGILSQEIVHLSLYKTLASLRKAKVLHCPLRYLRLWLAQHPQLVVPAMHRRMGHARGARKAGEQVAAGSGKGALWYMRPECTACKHQGMCSSAAACRSGPIWQSDQQVCTPIFHHSACMLHTCQY